MIPLFITLSVSSDGYFTQCRITGIFNIVRVLSVRFRFNVSVLANILFSFQVMRHCQNTNTAGIKTMLLTCTLSCFVVCPFLPLSMFLKGRVLRVWLFLTIVIYKLVNLAASFCSGFGIY